LALFAVGLLVATVSGMVQVEIRTRLGRVPYALIRLAAWRVPQDLRAELGGEWRSELAAILKAAEDVPVTGLVQGLWFALGLLFRGATVAREFSGTAKRARDAPMLKILLRHVRDGKTYLGRLAGRRISDRVTLSGTPGGGMAIRLSAKVALIVPAAALAGIAVFYAVNSSAGPSYMPYAPPAQVKSELQPFITSAGP
jgi:hypothetical protein